jgi:molybdate transport system permease protein
MPRYGPSAAPVVFAAGAVALVLFPLVRLALRIPWSSIGSQLLRPDALLALRLSLECSLGALGLSAVVGIPLAWVLARYRFPAWRVVRAVVTLPMCYPRWWVALPCCTPSVDAGSPAAGCTP